MPELPAFFANVLLPRFARSARVAEVEHLAPQLRRISFEGPALQGLSFSPGQDIKLRVGESALRHYTPSAYNATRGRLEVLFYLHGNGPGSRWASQLQVNDEVHLLGPKGRFGLTQADVHVLLGDETALGLFHSFAHSARGQVVGAVEVNPGCEDWVQRVQIPGVVAVPRQIIRGKALLAWLQQQPPFASRALTFYLVGHQGTVLQLRDQLLRAGWSRAQVISCPYWAEGKSGH